MAVPDSTPMDNEKHTKRMSRWVEYCLWAGGIVGLGYCGFVWSSAQYAQMRGSRELDQEIAAISQHPVEIVVPSPQKAR